MNQSTIDLEAMIGGIRRWVEIESPTTHIRGVNQIMDAVLSRVAPLDVVTERISGAPSFGDILIVRTANAGQQPGILLLSHLDTVHPVGAIATAPFRSQGSRLYGPGIYDMKGGAISRWKRSVGCWLATPRVCRSSFSLRPTRSSAVRSRDQ